MHQNMRILLLLLPWVLLGGDTNRDRATLAGVKAINVVVDPLDPQLAKTGLTDAMLRSRIEERLRKAAIPLDTSAVEFLGLHITSMQVGKSRLQMGQSPYSLCFALGLYQPVVLVRDQKIRTSIPTWNVNAILVVPLKPLAESSLSTADQLADIFVNAWRAVNPQ